MSRRTKPLCEHARPFVELLEERTLWHAGHMVEAGISPLALVQRGGGQSQVQSAQLDSADRVFADTMGSSGSSGKESKSGEKGADSSPSSVKGGPGKGAEKGGPGLDGSEGSSVPATGPSQGTPSQNQPRPQSPPSNNSPANDRGAQANSQAGTEISGQFAGNSTEDLSPANPAAMTPEAPEKRAKPVDDRGSSSAQNLGAGNLPDSYLIASRALTQVLGRAGIYGQRDTGTDLPADNAAADLPETGKAADSLNDSAGKAAYEEVAVEEAPSSALATVAPEARGSDLLAGIPAFDLGSLELRLQNLLAQVKKVELDVSDTLFRESRLHPWLLAVAVAAAASELARRQVRKSACAALAAAGPDLPSCRYHLEGLGHEHRLRRAAPEKAL